MHVPKCVKAIELLCNLKEFKKKKPPKSMRHAAFGICHAAFA